jgi:site-specific DNA-methyltransferase (adenine-specific)
LVAELHTQRVTAVDIRSGRRYLPDAALDLVYLDPPFNSNRDYNVIFRDESGNATDAQLLAFEDTWHWGRSQA